MIEAILVLRKAADDYASRAAQLEAGLPEKDELTDIAAGWHWLASEAITLCKKGKELSGEHDATCAQCPERCFHLPGAIGRTSSHYSDRQPAATLPIRLNLLRLDSAL